MSGAPAVSFPTGRSRKAWKLIFAVWLVGAACATTVCLRAELAGWRVSLLVSAIVVAGAAALVAIRDDAVGTKLSFDGRCWSAMGGSPHQPATLSVALDLQVLLLVRFAETPRTGRWFWLDRETSPDLWQDLRRAVYSRADPVREIAERSQAARESASPPFP